MIKLQGISLAIVYLLSGKPNKLSFLLISIHVFILPAIASLITLNKKLGQVLKEDEEIKLRIEKRINSKFIKQVILCNFGNKYEIEIDVNALANYPIKYKLHENQTDLCDKERLSRLKKVKTNNQVYYIIFEAQKKYFASSLRNVRKILIKLHKPIT